MSTSKSTCPKRNHLHSTTSFPPSNPFFLLYSLTSIITSIIYPVAQVRNMDGIPDTSVFHIYSITNHCHVYLLSTSLINEWLFISTALALQLYINFSLVLVCKTECVCCPVLSEDKLHRWRTGIIHISYLTIYLY